MKSLRSNTGFRALLGATLVLSIAGLANAASYLVRFQGNFDSGFGGLPATAIKGSYVFEFQPPTSVVNDGATANYAMSSATVELNGLAFATTPGYMRVDNNLPYGVGTWSDAYVSVYTVIGMYAGHFKLAGAGLGFNQTNSSPSALNSLDLPLSVSDLAGFGPSDMRTAWLTFENTSDSTGPFLTSGILTELSFTLIPEPGTITLLGLGLAVIYSRRRIVFPRE